MPISKAQRQQTKRTWREQDSCYLCQRGGQKKECSVPGCDRRDDEGKVKRMMGDYHVGCFYCPYHWYIACWQQYQQKCRCHDCQVVALEAAAQIDVSLAPDVPVTVVSCASVLQAASQAPVANKLIVEHVVQCAVEVATRLYQTVPSLHRLAMSEKAPVIMYGSTVGGWAVSNSDLDLVVVLRADIDHGDEERALIRAFLSSYYLEALTMDGVSQLQDLVVEKDTVSYFYTHPGQQQALKVDMSAEWCGETVEPSKVRLTKAVEQLLRSSQAADAATVIIAWAKAAGHCNDNNGVPDIRRLRSVRWAMLVAVTLLKYPDLAGKHLQNQVADIFGHIGNMPFSTHVLCLNTESVIPDLSWMPRDHIPGYHQLWHAEAHAQYWLTMTDKGARYAWRNMAKRVHYDSSEQSLFQGLQEASVKELCTQSQQSLSEALQQAQRTLRGLQLMDS